MKNKRAAVVGTTVAGLAVAGVSQVGSAHLWAYGWSSSGHTVSTSSNSYSNMVGFVQTVGADQRVCPGGYYDGIFGTNTKAQVKRMQNDLPTPGTSITVDGVVGSQTWNAVQNAWVSAIGTPNNIRRLIPLGGITWGQTGNYYYYGGGESYPDLAWGMSGGNPIWKFKVPGTSSWYSATTSRTMGSTSAC